MRLHHATQLRAQRAMLVVVSLVAIAAGGCGQNLPTAPTVADSPAPMKVVPAAMVAAPVWNWYQVASQAVSKGEAATVSGGRFKMQFARGALSAATTIKIMERDPLITDGIVGPSGMVLAKASVLTISYAGSNVEYLGDFLKLFRFNDVTGQWDQVAGTNDIAAKTFSAKVLVLGRYAVSGDPTKAGW
jgi:hypothetical protein